MTSKLTAQSLTTARPLFAAHNREVTAMSDVVHTGRRMTTIGERTSIEVRLIFYACYLPFLFAAVIRRLTPWRVQPALGHRSQRESIFREASRATKVVVGSSFVGL
jgi:hypothetical protein